MIYMKKLIPVIIILLVGVQGNAQLASEKPMDKVYTNAVRYKLQSRKTTISLPGGLPSNSALPKQVNNAKTKMTTSNQPTETTKKNLPSNRKMIQVLRKPKK